MQAIGHFLGLRSHHPDQLGLSPSGCEPVLDALVLAGRQR